MINKKFNPQVIVQEDGGEDPPIYLNSLVSCHMGPSVFITVTCENPIS